MYKTFRVPTTDISQDQIYILGHSLILRFLFQPTPTKFLSLAQNNIALYYPDFFQLIQFSEATSQLSVPNNLNIYPEN